MSVTVHPSLILWLSIGFYLEPRIFAPFLLAAGFHEMGHLLALRLLDRPAAGIRLGFLGAQIETGPMTYRQELLAAAAGPAFSLLLGLAFPLFPTLAVYSVILGCFNLLPIPRLDGWRVLRCLLLLHGTADTAARVVRLLSVLTGLGLWGGAIYLSGPMGFGLWPLIPAAVLLYRALTTEIL